MRTAIRILLVVVGLGLAATVAVDVAITGRRYDAWLDAHAAELGDAQRAVDRYQRRREAGRYAALPAKVERRDAEAAEVAVPVGARLEGERTALFATLTATRSRLRYGLVLAVVLLLVARAVPGRSPPACW